MVLFLDHIAIAVRDLDGAKRFFGLLGFEVADAVVIQGEQFSQYMGLPDLEADHVIMALPGAEPRQQVHLLRFHHPEPLDDAARARLDRIGINHFGFAVSDLKATLAILEAKGRAPARRDARVPAPQAGLPRRTRRNHDRALRVALMSQTLLIGAGYQCEVRRIAHRIGAPIQVAKR